MEAHGGNIYEYGEKGELIDFSSNINPFGVPECFRKAVEEALNRLPKYPDLHYASLRKNLSEYAGVEKDWVLPGNGAVDVIYKAIRASGAEKVLIAAPAFAEYRRGAELAGIPFEEAQLQSIEAGQLKIEEVKARIEQHPGKRLLFMLCNPNNPNGGLTPVEALKELAETLREMGGRLLVDEAFIEFTENYPESSFTPLLKDHENVMTVRALTKFFGMPGIRLGYGITANRDWRKRVEAISEPWAINTFAEIAAETVLTDENYIKKTKAWLREERTYLIEALRKIKHISVYPTYSDFLLCRIDHEGAGFGGMELYEKLLSRGILIRRSLGFKGLDEHYFRLAIKDRNSNIKLLDALHGAIGA